jgi:hypothetical protein
VPDFFCGLGRILDTAQVLDRSKESDKRVGTQFQTGQIPAIRSCAKLTKIGYYALVPFRAAGWQCQPISSFTIHDALTMLSNILIPLALLGSLGVAIDFLLGTTRQEAIKDWLLARWVKFEDMKWSNFSKREAELFIAVSDKIFGDRFWSARRFSVSILILGAFVTAWWMFRWAFVTQDPYTALLGTFEVGLPLDLRQTLFQRTISMCLLGVSHLLLLMISLSITRRFCDWTIRLASKSGWGIAPFLGLLIVSYGLFVVWYPLATTMNSVINILMDAMLGLTAGNAESPVRFLANAMYQRYQYLLVEGGIKLHWSITYPFAESLEDARGKFDSVSLACFSMDYLASLFRMAVALGSLSLFVFRKWIASLCSLVWRRIIEDKKGTFTLILGGIGGIAGIVKEIAGHL